jgi:hypothetical protein
MQYGGARVAARVEATTALELEADRDDRGDGLDRGEERIGFGAATGESEGSGALGLEFGGGDGRRGAGLRREQPGRRGGIIEVPQRVEARGVEAIRY